jgi:enoyl-CoA hydratase/carnithine racemase
MSAPGEPVTVTHAGAITTLRLDREAKRNAINLAMWRALRSTLRAVCDRPKTRVVILCGAGGHFAAGADISEFHQVFADRATTLAYAREMAAVMAALEDMPMPIIAVIEGLCVGAGVALALACDTQYASAEARFAITPAKLGLIYSLADTVRLTRAVGQSRAKDLLFTGRMIDAATAARIGLVTEVAAPDQLQQLVEARAGLMVEASPWSIAQTKRVTGSIAQGATGETPESQGWFADATGREDFMERAAAFLGRRMQGRDSG